MQEANGLYRAQTTSLYSVNPVIPQRTGVRLDRRDQSWEIFPSSSVPFVLRSPVEAIPALLAEFLITVFLF